MGPDFLYSGQVRNCQAHVPRGCTPRRECQVPHSTQTQHPRPWLVCSGTENSAPLDCPRIVYLTSASSRKPMVVALSNSTYSNSGAPQRPRSAFVQKTLGGQRGPAKTHSCLTGFIHFYFFCFIFLPEFYYTVQAGLELVSILITVLCGAVQFLQC